MMRIEFNRTGAERKALVKAISEITGAAAVYKYMPTCAYEIDYFTVTKDGALEFDDRADNEEIETLLEQLAERGFTAAEMSDVAAEKVSEDAAAEPQGESVGLTVTIPLDKVAVGNLTKLLDAKGSLIKKALGIAELPLEINEDAVSFPWFDACPDADTANDLYQDMFSRAQLLNIRASENSSYMVPEILAIPEETLEKFRSTHSGLKHFGRLLDQLLERKSHTL